ncbi:MAG: cytochrome c family protein, partial [Thermoanaerobaculia bacterium]
DYARKRLEAAAEVEILPPATVSRPGLLEFAVKVRNVGAGHYLPTGMTEMRQMWLDVRVVDANGTEIYSSGAVDDAGEIEPNAAIFRTVLGDESGNPTWRMWEATHILYDHRIPPKGYRVERYAAYVPPDTGLPLTVRATLRYRSVSPQLAKELLADEAPPIPVIDMRQAAITVE